MSQGITFQLGPAAVRIEGDHLVTRWAQSAFDFLKCDSEPALRFTFADGPVQTAGWDCVGDDSARVSPTAVSFRLPYFEVRFSRDRRPEELSIQLRQRDCRPL